MRHWFTSGSKLIIEIEQPEESGMYSKSPMTVSLPTALAILIGAPVSTLAQTNSADFGSGDLKTPAAQTASEAEAPEQAWNWHAQSTAIVQGYPGFSAKYSGPNSLRNGGEVRETISVDIYAGVRLWRGAEAHIDGLMWQGFGLSKTLGVEGFPSGEAFRLGTDIPNVNLPRVFLRQTINLGGETE